MLAEVTHIGLAAPAARLTGPGHGDHPSAIVPTTRLRVLIVSDHPLLRYGLRALLNSRPEIELVGEAESSEHAVEAVALLHPDVVVMDEQATGMDGPTATRRILATSSQAGVLLMTESCTGSSVLAAMRAGARGYLVKDAGTAEVVRAVQTVGAGGAVFSPAVAQRVFSHLSATDPPRATRAFPGLTEREEQVLDLLAKGDNNDTIARRLAISSKTVRNHVSIIFAKMAVADRAQAVARGREAGFGL